MLRRLRSGLASLRGALDRGRSVRSELGAILDSVADGVTVIDGAGRIRYANVAAAELNGTSVADMVGRPGSEIAGRLEVLDESGSLLDLERLPTRQVAAGADRAEATVRFRSANGTERWSIVRSRAIRDRHGRLRRVVSAFQDVTAIKESEHRLAFLAQVSATLAESIDYELTLRRVANAVVPQLADWCVVDVVEPGRGLTRVAAANVNPEQLRLADEVEQRWPRDPEAPGVLREVMDTRRPAHMTNVTDEMLRTGARDAAHLAVLRKLRIREVLTVPLEAREHALGTLSLILSESARTFTPADVTLAREIGRRAGAAIDAARLLNDAQEALRMRDEFMAVASHDMRTPLATVGGYAQLVRRNLEPVASQVDPLVFGMLDKVDAGLARLNRLVADFMDATLIRAGQPIPLQLEPTDMGGLVERVANEHRSQAPSLRIEVERGEDLPSATIDAGRMERVMDNLVGNAVKFGAAGGEIRICVEGRDGAVLVTVSDLGTGIHPDDLPHIFEPHFRGRNAVGLPGSGLGLAGSRVVVEQMGGTLTAANRPGGGAAITIHLPLPA